MEGDSVTTPRFFAHSHPDEPAPGAKWHTLGDHLRDAANLAEAFAGEASATLRSAAASRLTEVTRSAALVHDLGKYSQDFQRRLRGEPVQVVHSLQGAKVAAAKKSVDAAMAIAGHHAGIPSLSAFQDAFASLRHDPDEIWPIASKDLAELERIRFSSVPQELVEDRLRAEVCIRLLFSCLVDADYLDTERHFEPEKAARRASIPLDAGSRLETLLEATRRVSHKCPEGPVKAARKRVLDACLAAARHPPGFFSLTVPTGGGKTLSSMAFSLRHAELHGLRRIIYVLPYLNIIEQNARILSEIFGNQAVLEHHSLVDAGSDPAGATAIEVPETPRQRLAAENWDSPLIVTTSVQFFESLFANRPSRCRKLHRIPRSVIVLDECQTLPTGLVAPILSMLTTLVEDYGVTVVFCTATQPAFHLRRGFECGIPAKRVREIVPEGRELFRVMQRTEPRWETAGPTSWERLAERIAECRQALAVVNLRAHARELFRQVSALVPEGTYYLSTDLCPVHRLGRLDEIRARLAKGLECRVVSTQLIEAGVDVDFPDVFRALGPLDSIAQAAGRCNREGRLVEAGGQPRRGIVTVFLPEDHRVASGVYRLATDKTLALINEAIARTGEGPDLHDPAVYQDYFRRLYVDTDLDAHDLQRSRDSARRRLDFPKVADLFELIPKATTPVIVEYDGQARGLVDLLRRAVKRAGYAPRGILRQLQRYQVQRWPNEFAGDRQLYRVEALAEDTWVWVARYDEALGVGAASDGQNPLCPEDLII